MHVPPTFSNSRLCWQKEKDNDSNYDNFEDDDDDSCSSNDSSGDEADAPVTLLRLMTAQPKLTSLITSFLNGRANNDSAKVNPRSSREIHILHVAAQHGCISQLKRLITPDQV